MKNVLVIMSTYNGEMYIQEQIDSILNQKNVSVDLLIRDDGSTDRTREIIDDYSSRVKMIKGINIGCEKSFFRLLELCHGYDYYAFSDQDDYWEPNKISSAIDKINNEVGPALAGCNLLVCDGYLNPLREMFSSADINILQIQMKRDVLRNIHGCVLVWNDALNNILISNMPKCDVTHDVWVNAVANITGVVKIDEKALIRYRLHGLNVSGFALSSLGRMKKAIKVYWGENRPRRDVIAMDLLNKFEKYMDKDKQSYETLCCLRDYRNNKLALLKQPIVSERPLLDRLFWTISIFINRY